MKKQKNKTNKKTIIYILVAFILVILIIILLIKLKKTFGVSYIITYNGLNCPTAYVALFSDGTYEYYEHFGTEEKGLKPTYGKYNYDMNKLIENVNEYEDTNGGPYTIKLSTGEQYTTYGSNKYLRELLDNNNIVLEKCMSNEEE